MAQEGFDLTSFTVLITSNDIFFVDLALQIVDLKSKIVENLNFWEKFKKSEVS